MKGILSVIIVVILLASFVVIGATATYHVYSNGDDTSIIQSQKVLTFGNNKLDIIPQSVIRIATAPAESTGEDFEIICDKNVYYGYDKITIYCDITNLKDEVVMNHNMSLIFNPKISGLATAYMWDENLIVGTACSEYIQEEICFPAISNETGEPIEECYYWYSCSAYENIYGGYEETNKLFNSVKGLTFGKLETKRFKLIINIPINTQGKFDVIIGNTILDPWWSSSYLYRYKIIVNSTSLLSVAVNVSDSILWALQHNDSYAYSTIPAPNGAIAIANDTHEKYWENQTDNTTGNSYRKVWDNSFATAVYHFEESSPFSQDSSQYDNDATVTQVTSFENDCVFGYCYDFDGIDDYVRMPDNAGNSITGDASSSMWIYPHTLGAGERYFYSKKSGANDNDIWLDWSPTGGGDLAIYITSDGTAGTVYKYTTPAAPLVINKWQLVVATFNAASGGLEIWVNDTNQTGGAIVGAVQHSIHDGVSDIAIGVDSNDWITANFDGLIDEFRLYNRTLSPTEIRQLYYQGINNFTRFGAEEKIDIGNTTLNNISYATHPYEIINNSHMVNITLYDDAMVTGVLDYDGTEYSIISSNSTPDTWGFTRDIIPDLATTDGELKYFFWNFSYTYTNGTTFVNITTPVFSQQIQYAWYFSIPTGNITTGYSGEAIKINTTLTDLSSGLITVTNKSSTLNNTLYSATQSGSEYYAEMPLPTVSTSRSIYYNFSAYLTYADNSIIRYSSTNSVTVNPILIQNCSAGGLPVLTFYYFDEENPYKSINASMEMSIWIWVSDQSTNVSYNFTFDKNHSHTVCISPSTASANAFSIQQYENDLDVDGVIYSARNYHLNGIRISNVTTEINNYLLNSTYADVIAMDVEDRYGDPVNNVLIVAQRYYIGEDTYRTVATGLTDTSGETTIRLRSSIGEDNIQYRFLLYRNFQLVKQYEDMFIIGSSITFPLEDTGISTFWNVWKTISYNCQWVNSTQLLSCEYQDNVNLIQSASLYVRQVQSIGYTEICNQTSTEAANVLFCDLSGMTTETYDYWFEVVYTGELFVIERGTIQNLAAGRFGDEGYLIAFIMLLSFSLIGYNDEKVMIALGLVSIIICQLIGFTVGSWAGIVSLIIAGGLILYKG